MDLVSRYRRLVPGHKRHAKIQMTEKKWLARSIFLESVAGVPGTVGGMLRRMRSLGPLKRIMTAGQDWLMQLLVLGAQGVFFNGFFLSYPISPQTCHRFVGYLEEEAALTYSRAIENLEAGKLPQWEKLLAPEIAVYCWKIPEGNRTMEDLLLYICVDEANHTLGNLNQEFRSQFVRGQV
ncbi:alternative oxidase [Aspergillus novofumigatus IBT 16806]|uniref:Alternative oxidase n=1 Tax=Aspergillus novofumigatus (strain IBT 16806) TaxID=1392255 RepID=A0A2I1CH01_ASPN1|nr:uncharacterized protein P174DRAFT_457640 [Aspergillus novofumigatus IBT 16806]PKX96897.1 hypothetical protein P174DRAFT_457640 [Aspergillus novofumigatus IBT 16806]